MLCKHSVTWFRTWGHELESQQMIPRPCAFAASAPAHGVQASSLLHYRTTSFTGNSIYAYMCGPTRGPARDGPRTRCTIA